jgi:hypothetical protein
MERLHGDHPPPPGAGDLPDVGRHLFDGLPIAVKDDERAEDRTGRVPIVDENAAVGSSFEEKNSHDNSGSEVPGFRSSGFRSSVARTPKPRTPKPRNPGTRFTKNQFT